MSCRLVVTPAAEDDLLQAYSWYETKQFGLGTLFLESVEAVYERMLEHPELYQEVDEGIRRGVTRTFPYCIFYTLQENDIIVLGIIDAAQDPDYIRSRWNV